MQVLHGFQVNCVGDSVFSLKKKSGWEIINTPLTLGALFYMPCHNTCGEQHKVGNDLMNTFVEKLRN